jgi:hypothetical protein
VRLVMIPSPATARFLAGPAAPAGPAWPERPDPTVCLTHMH